MIVNGFNITKKGILTAYKGKSKELEIPSDVVEIDHGVFSGIELNSVVLPNSVKKIPADLFYNQKELMSVTIDSPIDEIPDSCFYNCEKLESLTIPEGVTKVGKRAFYNCSSLANVVFPSTLKEIKDDAFRYCKALKEAVLPDGFESIGKNAFSDCENLYIVVIPGSAKVDMSLYPFGFTSNKEHRRYVIPENSKLSDELLKTKVELETEARKYGFEENVDVECVMFKPNELETVLSELRGKSSATKENKPVAKLQIEDGILISCLSPLAREIVIPEGVIEIKDSAFENNYSIKKVVSESTCLKRIGNAAFKNSVFLEEAYFQYVEEEIGEEAFSGCDALRRVTFERGSFRVGRCAFQNANLLRYIVLPDGVTSIDDEAFIHRTSLGMLYVSVPSSVFSLSDRATDGVSYVLADSNTLIPKYCSEYEHRRGDYLENTEENVKLLNERLAFEDAVESKEFTVYGEKIEATNTIDIYQDTVRYYEDKREESILSLIRVLPTALNGKLNSETVLDDLLRLNKEMGKRMEKYGIPADSVTPIQSSAAFIELQEKYYSFLTTCYELLGNANSYLNDVKAELRFEAESKVTGLSYGILTSSALDMIAYSIDDIRERKRQREAAYAEANKVLEGKAKEARNLVNKNFEEFVQQVIPEFETAVSDYISALISDELDTLDWQRIIQKAIIDKYDISKSVSIVSEASKNIHIDKAKALATALREHPGNKTAYDFARATGLYNDEIASLESFCKSLEGSREKMEAAIAARNEKERKSAEDAKAAELAKAQADTEARAKHEESLRKARLKASQERYDQLSQNIIQQKKIIEKNSGWFGMEAKTRKAAQAELSLLEKLLLEEFPNGKP